MRAGLFLCLCLALVAAVFASLFFGTTPLPMEAILASIPGLPGEPPEPWIEVIEVEKFAISVAATI